MSKIADVMTLLRTRVAGVLTSHAELPHPEFPEENNAQRLDLAYGIQYADASNSQRFVSNRLSINQNFLITITRKIRANEYAVSSWQDGFEAIFEDRALVISAIESEPTLGDSTKVCRAGYVFDSGPLRVFDDTDRYVKIEMSVVVEYFEDTN